MSGIREALRRRLETAAKNEEISLNAEMVRRLENSFAVAENAMLLEALLGGGFKLELLRAISVMLMVAGDGFVSDKQVAKNLVDAIGKLVDVFGGRRPLDESEFPLFAVKGSADQFAWGALLVARFHIEMSLNPPIQSGESTS